MAVDIYSNNRRNTVPNHHRRKCSKARTNSVGKTRSRKWLSTAAAAILTVLICLTINYRAYSEFSREVSEYENLNHDVFNLTTENIALQEEIESLRSDSKKIEREARRFGFDRSKEKVPVPAK